jgi:hypothetical protein
VETVVVEVKALAGLIALAVGTPVVWVLGAVVLVLGAVLLVAMSVLVGMALGLAAKALVGLAS